MLLSAEPDERVCVQRCKIDVSHENVLMKCVSLHAFARRENYRKFFVSSWRVERMAQSREISRGRGVR